MFKRTLKFFVLILLASCAGKTEQKSFQEENLIKPVDFGEYHTLLDDGIKLFLPQGFNELSESEILAFHENIKDEKTRYFYEKSYEQRKYLQGNVYDFFNPEYAGEVVVTTLPYTPFDKSSAGQLLYMLRKGHEHYQEITGIAHKKTKARYFGDRNLQVFKAIYVLDHVLGPDEINDEEVVEIFKTVYVISSNNKTFILNFITPFDIDLDPFIQKIKFM